MDWINDYQLFLLDFDGLLVNTEALHYEAYQRMCKDQGIELQWGFNTYCSYAHKDATAVKKRLYQEFPNLNPDWDALYEIKRRHYSELLVEKGVELMPGVANFLYALKDANVKRCVVTHSADLHVNPIKAGHAALETIPHWIMRDDYVKPKPDPECYVTAIRRYASPGDQIIGFEDTPRGIKALSSSNAKAIWISAVDYPNSITAPLKHIPRFDSFETLVKQAPTLNSTQP